MGRKFRHMAEGGGPCGDDGLRGGGGLTLVQVILWKGELLLRKSVLWSWCL